MQSKISRAANSGAITRCRSRWRAFVIRAFAVTFGLIFSLVLAELIVRVAAPQDLSGTWRRNDDFGLSVHQQNHSVRHQCGKRVLRYRFTKNGLRDLGQGDGEISVLCLGDSFTFGWLLRDEDTFVAKLQAMADREFGPGRFALLNGGHGGWGTSDCVRYFEEYGNDLGVNAVIVFLNMDDIGRSLQCPNYLINADGTLTPISRSADHSGSWMKRIANSLPFYQWTLEHCHLVQLARRVILRGNVAAREAPTAQQLATVPQSSNCVDSVSARRFARALFQRLQQVADERSVRLLVLTTGFHQPASGRELEPTKLFMLMAAQDLADDGIAFHDCTDDMNKRLGGDYSSVKIDGDGHPNEAGASLIADMNWEFVRAFLADLDEPRHDGEVKPAGADFSPASKTTP